MMENNEIEKARIQMQQRLIDKESASLYDSMESLPNLTWGDIEKRVRKGEKIVVIENAVFDIKNFVDQHPGGRQTLLHLIGLDATSLFESVGAEHQHTKVNHRLLCRTFSHISFSFHLSPPLSLYLYLKEAYKFLSAMRIGSVRRDDGQRP